MMMMLSSSGSDHAAPPATPTAASPADLLWTPERLKAWLGPSTQPASVRQQQQEQLPPSQPSTSTSQPSQASAAAAHLKSSQRQLVQLLPLVSSVASQRAAAASSSIGTPPGRCPTPLPASAAAAGVSPQHAAAQRRRAARPRKQRPNAPLSGLFVQQQQLASLDPQQIQPSSAARAGQQQLPPKVAQPGEYAAPDRNPAWDPAALARAAAEGAARLEVAVEPAPAARPQLGVLMLVHDKGVPAAAAWQAWQQAQAGRVVVRVHLKAGVAPTGLPGEAWMAPRLLDARVRSEWGCISLTEAVLGAAAEMLQRHPQLQHLAVVSGQDVPVASPPRLMPAGLSLFGRFQFGRAFDAACGVLAAQCLQQQLGMAPSDAAAWGAALTFHHTWLVLDRQLLLALLSKQDEVLAVGRALSDRFMQPDVAVAGDEWLLCTAALRFGFVRQVEHKGLFAYVAAWRRRKENAALPGGEEGGAQRGRRHAESAGEEAADAEAAGAPPAKAPRLSARQAQRAIRAAEQQLAGGGGGGAPAHVDSASGSIGGASSRAGPEHAGAAVAASSAAGDDLAVAASAAPAPAPASAAAATTAAADDSLACHDTVAASSAGDAGGVEAEAGILSEAGSSGRSIKKERQEAAAPAAGAGPASAPLNGATPQPQQDAEDASQAGSSSSSALGSAHGVLLDCCPTLALFHPSESHTRHPHEWRGFSQPLLVDVHSSRLGPHKLVLLQALALAKPNGALFFRKVGGMGAAPESGDGGGAAGAQLLACLRLLWRGRRLPSAVEELKLRGGSGPGGGAGEEAAAMQEEQEEQEDDDLDELEA